ncbi:hypothetical protein Tco_1488631 [Tanacetum coccineum]
MEENGQTRLTKYSELTEEQKLQDDCDIQATNIILHGLPPDVYALGETLYEYYWRFSQLINDMHIIGMTMQQLYAYPSQHERYAHAERVMRERYPDPLALVSNSPTLYNPPQSPQHSVPTMHPPPQQFTPVTQQSQAEFPQLDSGLAIPMFQQGENPIDCINKALTFISVVASRFPPSNNQL